MDRETWASSGGLRRLCVCHLSHHWDPIRDAHNIKEEKVIWLVVAESSVHGWPAPKQKWSAEGSSGGQLPGHSGQGAERKGEERDEGECPPPVTPVTPPPQGCSLRPVLPAMNSSTAQSTEEHSVQSLSKGSGEHFRSKP